MMMSSVRAPQKRVLILGTGAAGRTAARRLHDAGYTITVLEARPRIGGRAWTTFALAPYPLESLLPLSVIVQQNCMVSAYIYRNANLFNALRDIPSVDTQCRILYLDFAYFA